jgi:dolichol-phosphate mannosyltransferase
VAQQLSIVVPVYNEFENLPTLANRVIAAMDKLQLKSWEIILVNDGSTDDTFQVLQDLASKDNRFRPIHFEQNSGQSAAIDAGFKEARYALVGTLDADLQNDPFDYEILLSKMKEGVGVVCGIRVNRHDTRSKKFASKIANWFRNKVTHETITDTGCSLKIYRKEALNKIKLYDGMHRFLPTLIKMEGFEAVEVPVGHHPRFAGVSKYSTFKRGWTAFFDLMAVRWMQKRKLHYRISEIGSNGQSPENASSKDNNTDSNIEALNRVREDEDLL